MTLIPISQNGISVFAAYQKAYSDYLKACEKSNDVALDLSGVQEISILCAKELFGQLLIKNKCKEVLCKNVDLSLFFNISNGIKAYFDQEFPQGIPSQYGAVTIISPQVEMENDDCWHTIHLGDDVVNLVY